MQALDRPHFFDGRLLTAEDLNREQAYHRDRARRHNRFAHGWGIVSGLDLRLDGPDAVEIGPGMAIDCAGNEIVVPSATRLPLTTGAARRYLVLSYRESAVDPMPARGARIEAATLREGFALDLVDQHPGRGHRHRGPGTPGCGQAHPLCLATLTASARGWKLLRVKPASRSHPR